MTEFGAKTGDLNNLVLPLKACVDNNRETKCSTIKCEDGYELSACARNIQNSTNDNREISSSSKFRKILFLIPGTLAKKDND